VIWAGGRTSFRVDLPPGSAHGIIRRLPSLTGGFARRSPTNGRSPCKNFLLTLVYSCGIVPHELPTAPTFSPPRKFLLHFFSFTCKSPCTYSHAYSPLFSCVCRLFTRIQIPIPNPLNPLAALHTKTPGGGVRPQKRESPDSFQSGARSASSALASVAGDSKTPRPLRTLSSRRRLLLRTRRAADPGSRPCPLSLARACFLLSSPSAARLPLTPLECADPRNRLATPLDSALPKSLNLKPSRISSSEKTGRGAPTPVEISPPSSSLFTSLHRAESMGYFITPLLRSLPTPLLPCFFVSSVCSTLFPFLSALGSRRCWS
jgi:hypothetical protein